MLTCLLTHGFRSRICMADSAQGAARALAVTTASDLSLLLLAKYCTRGSALSIESALSYPHVNLLPYRFTYTY